MARNRVLCLCCGRIVESFSRHHFATCGCPNGTFTDGGRDYFRGGGMDISAVLYLPDDVLADKPKRRKTKLTKSELKLLPLVRAASKTRAKRENYESRD